MRSLNTTLIATSKYYAQIPVPLAQWLRHCAAEPEDTGLISFHLLDAGCYVRAPFLIGKDRQLLVLRSFVFLFPPFWDEEMNGQSGTRRWGSVFFV